MRELLESYSLRVLRIVAKNYLPDPKQSGNQTERHKLRNHYRYFLCRSSKEELIGALLPYMNSNAKKILDETAVWIELYPKHSKGNWKGRLVYNKEQWTKRKLVSQWMKEHPAEVSKICDRGIHTLCGTS